MASNAKETLIRRISGTPGKGTGSNTGLGTTDIVIPEFPVIPDKLTRESADAFRDGVRRWRASLQAQFPVPQPTATTATSTNTGSVTEDQLLTAISGVNARVDNAIAELTSKISGSGTQNTAVGALALNSVGSGQSNSALGSSALAANTTGSDNTSAGYLSLSSNTTGSRNVGLGVGALGSISSASNNNVAIGYYAGLNLTSGSGNVIIGYNSQPASNTGSNQLCIGNIIYGVSIDGTNSSISTGNIGIGVKVPDASYKLDVAGAVKSTYQRFGSGSPEGVVSAAQGAIYSNSAGGSNTSLYVKESGGTGNTGWVALLTSVSVPPGTSGIAVVNTVADLKALNPASYVTAITLGYWSAYDGGGAVYCWSSSTIGTNDGSKILSSVSGSWSNTATVVNVRQWGAKDNDSTYTNAARINAAIAYAGTFSSPPQVVIPPGLYYLETSVVIRSNNISIDLYGTLKNKNTVATPVVIVSQSSTYSASTSTGVVTNYGVKNVFIDGKGVGVIDQNSQNVSDWTYSSSHPNAGYHTVWAYGVDGISIKDVTIQNGVVWSVSIECCKNFEVSGCKVYTGFANGRMINGHYHFLSAQDGIHSHDSKDGFIHHNIVECGDDAYAVSAQRTNDAGNVVVSDNRGQVKVLAYNPDGTINHYSPSGRFGLSCFNSATSSYCLVSNVTFANNVIQGGQGLFCVYDDGVSHSNKVPINVRFIGNTFADQNSAGDVNAYGNSMTMDDNGVITNQIGFGWIIDGCENLEFVGNTFNNIARVGRIGGTSAKNGTVVFRSNKFSNFKRGYPYNFPTGETTSAVIWMSQGTKLIVDGNTFENNDIVPCYVGNYENNILDTYEEVLFNNNTCFNNNLRWLSSTPSGVYAGVLSVNGVKYIEFNGNKITNNYGPALFAKSSRTIVSKNNKIKGLGSGSFTGSADAFYITNAPSTSLSYTDIQCNNVENIDGQFLYGQNTGKLFIQNNVINNPCRSYNTGYLMSLIIDGSSLSTDPYTLFGGFMFGNTSYRSSGQCILYMNSSQSTSSYTGNKFAYSLSQNNFGSNYTAPDIQANASGLH